MVGCIDSLGDMLILARLAGYLVVYAEFESASARAEHGQQASDDEIGVHSFGSSLSDSNRFWAVFPVMYAATVAMITMA